MSLKNLYWLICGIFFVFSCKNDPLHADTSNVKVSIDYLNLDSIFVSAKGEDLANWNKRFKSNIKEAYDFQLGVAMRIGSSEDSVVLTNIDLFANDPSMRVFQKEIEKKFTNLPDRHQKIENGFRNLKYHFPKMKIPSTIVYANTCFQSSAFATQNEIIVGLERYLGAKNEAIQNLPGDVFFEWIKDGMEDKFLERDVLCTWALTSVVDMVEGNLAENMVNWGKVIYFTEASFPDEEKEIILRYSVEDLKWAYENEFALWTYLVNEKLLFKINERESTNMLGPGPFTIGLPEKGPDRLGQFLGWRMIHSFMNENDVSLEQLLKTPYTKILQAYEIE